MLDLPFLRRSVLAVTLCGVVAALAAQPKSAAVPASAPATIPTADELADVREQLITMVRMTPMLMQVVEADPSLLANGDYVSRNNPQLAQFLAQHPEVVRNPDFYLFADLGRRDGRKVEPLRRPGARREGMTEQELHREYVQMFSALLAFVAGAGALLWLIRLLLENRRWSRAFRQQGEIHGKLIERFSSNQELVEYMNSDPGRRFLEATPIPIDTNGSRPLPGGWARVLGPLQFGIVLSMLGVGMLILEHSVPDYSTPFLLAAMVALMPGLGFIISAIVTWRLSERLGLMPHAAQENRQ